MFSETLAAADRVRKECVEPESKIARMGMESSMFGEFPILQRTLGMKPTDDTSWLCLPSSTTAVGISLTLAEKDGMSSSRQAELGSALWRSW